MSGPMQTEIALEFAEERILKLETALHEAVLKLEKVCKWLGKLENADCQRLKVSRFESLNEAYRADILNYQATRKDLEKTVESAKGVLK